MTTKLLIETIEESIRMVIDGYPSRYIDHTDNNNKHWVIRVSDHNANPLRVDENMVSIVVLGESNSGFRNLPNQYFVDSDGFFFDNFKTMEEFINYVID